MYSKTPIILTILGGNMLGFLLNTHIVWSSAIIPKLKNITTSPFGRDIDTEEASWISSSWTLGAIVGPALFMYLSEKMGKKLTLLFAGIPFLLGNLILAFAITVDLYIISRFVIGLSSGALFLMPIYISELSHKNLRGTLCSTLTCAACLGIVFCDSVGPFVSIKLFSLTLSGMTACFLVLFCFIGEEVPYYYIKNNDAFHARASLERLRGGYEDIDDIFNEMQTGYLEDSKASLIVIFRSKALKKGFIICAGLMIAVQLTGFTAVMFYGQAFFQSVSSSNISPEISVILLSIVNLLSSFLAPGLSSTVGRKKLLIISGIGIILVETVLGIYSYWNLITKLPQLFTVVPLYGLTLFIICFNIGFGPVPWIIMGEIFPTRVKALATSLVGCIFWTSGFITTKYFLQIVDHIGLHGYFGICAGFTILATIFTKFYVIETKDKSLEEIQRELSL